MNPQQALEELERTANPQKRGSLFESFIADLLEQQGFDLTLNPRTAA
jgi:hypothetical protein